MKLTYRQRILSYFLVVFALFAVSIIVIEQKKEKAQRVETLEDKLDGYAEIIHAYIEYDTANNQKIDRLPILSHILPKEVRVTIIDTEGKVLFDKDVADVSTLDNHLNRPEIRNASFQTRGLNIRFSASTKHEYIYYAKKYPNYFVRVAVPYNINTINFLQPDNMFIYIVLGLFVVVLILLYYVAGRFSKSISQLKKFATIIKEDKPLPTNLQFQNDELGEIGSQLVDILKQKEKSKHDIELEREKLIQHFQLSEEGICIFTADRQKMYANTHFFQYINLIIDQPLFNTELIFKYEVFAPVLEFINQKKHAHGNFTYQISHGGKVYLVKTLVFEDLSFAITIKDISKIEKTRQLKQEMTNNIAHELRTPVASLRGYLETLNENQLPPEKQAQFINRAYLQIIRLSNIIEDISLISKIEEPGSNFELEKIHLHQLIDEVRIDLTDKLREKNVHLDIAVNNSITVSGNYTLLYSIFRNLMDNSISYAGKGIEIHINNYMEDDNYLYFSYYDTGKGVEEQYLNRLFERFYRASEGRTRETGGSGLGLSIVKNAILFHHGTIEVKNHLGGGLEFLFTIKK